MSLIGFEHAGIYARDYLALSDWYIQVFGGEVLEEDTGKRFVRLFGNAVLEFIRTEEKNIVDLQKGHCNGIRHIAFLTDDYAAAKQLLEDKQVRIVGGFDVLERGIRNLFFTDPEGNLMQVTYRSVPII